MKQKPIIYQLLPRIFANYNPNCVPNGSISQNGSGKLNDINDKVLAAIKDMGFTHVWYTGVIEHAHCSDYTKYGIKKDNPYVVKGKAGSPYAIKDYYDIDPDLAEDVPNRMQEFQDLVTRTHDAGLNVIIDFVPNHVARQYHSDSAPAGVEDFGSNDDTTKQFDPQNNFYYITRQQFAPSFNLGEGRDQYVEFPAKVSGNDCFTAFPSVNDWYETVKLNYGVDYLGGRSNHFSPLPNTWIKMLNILRFWASKGVDAFRCDMVFMVPLEFWQWAIPLVKEKYPRIKFIAEIYDVCLYRDFINIGGFDYLYDKVTLYDTLRGIQTANVSAAAITSCWQTVEGIAPNMLNFLENHDEQRFGSPQYAGNPALVTPSLVVSAMISTCPLMIYAGQELGEQATDAEGFSGRDGRSSIFDYWSISTLRRWLNNGNPSLALLTGEEIKLRNLYKKILVMCNRERAIRKGRFFDLMYVNYDNPTMSPHKHYAFIRHVHNETLIIGVNFDNNPANIQLNIPVHAFDVLSIAQGKYNATELLGDKKTKAVIEVAPDKPFPMQIPANGAVIWKITKPIEPTLTEVDASGKEIINEAEAEPEKEADNQD